MTTVDLVRPDSLSIADEALARIQANRLVGRALEQEACRALLAQSRRVHVVAVGKAAVSMGTAVRSSAGDAFASGIAVPAAGCGPVPGFTVMPGDHPLPGESSLRAAAAVRQFLSGKDFDGDDLVVFAVSGGGSALVSEPLAPLDLGGLRLITETLLRAGIDVTRINHLRTALSGIHGGELLPLAGRARRLGLILSDNVQVGSQAVASGLVHPEPVDLARAHDVLNEAKDLLPEPVVDRIHAALAGRPATRAGDSTILNLVVGSTQSTLDRCTEAARGHGYHVVSLGPALQGEARWVAGKIGAIAREVAAVIAGPVCLLGTGEVTVSVRGSGRGGRCQELAWAMMPQITDLPGASFTAMSTDGQDFLPGVMGARVNRHSMGQAVALGYDWQAVLDRNDTHPALARLGQCLPGRPTDTNLCDIYALTWDPDGEPG